MEKGNREEVSVGILADELDSYDEMEEGAWSDCEERSMIDNYNDGLDDICINKDLFDEILSERVTRSEI